VDAVVVEAMVCAGFGAEKVLESRRPIITNELCGVRLLAADAGSR